jgi:hypothetical protein
MSARVPENLKRTENKSHFHGRRVAVLMGTPCFIKDIGFI